MRVWLVALALVLSCAGKVLATEPWQLLVLSEQADASRQHQPQLLRRVEQSLLDQLANAGQTVYDRRLAGLPGCGDAGCFGLDDVALVSLARRSSKTIDAVLLYDIEVAELTGPALTRWQIRIPLYMIELETGKRISSWQGFSREFADLPSGCTDNCFSLWLAERAALVAADAGYAITERLQSYARTYRYTLQLEGFAVGEYQAIEQWLLEPTEFEQARLALQHTQHNRRQLLHAIADKTYSLATQRGAGSTEALLRRVFDDHGMAVQVQLQPGTRYFQISRQGLPYLNRYLLALLLLLLFTLAAAYGRFLLREQPKLKQLLAEGRLQSLQQHFDTLQRKRWPWPASWRNWQQQARAAQQALQRLTAQTEQALQRGDFAECKAALAELSQSFTDSGELKQLMQRLERAETAQQLIAVAQSEQAGSVAKALRHYSEALQLNPYLQDTLAPVISQCQQTLRAELVSGALSQGASLLGSQQPYQALAQLDLALLQIGQLAHFVAERQQLQQLREQAIAALTVEQISDTSLNGKPLCLKTPTQRIRLWLSDSLLIARKTVPEQASLALGYQRLSRPGKQNLLRYHDRSFWVEDQGSSNGSWLSSTASSLAFSELGSKAVAISQPVLLAMGGEKAAGRPGICQLRLSPGQQVPGALLVQLEHSSLSLLEQSAISESWHSLAQDAGQSGVLLAQQLALGLYNGELDIGCVAGSTPLAILSRSEGYLWLEPVLNADTSSVTLAGVKQYGAVPLQLNQTFQLAELALQLTKD